MEDRLTRSRAGRPGAALVALLVIIAITAAWWALALWPVGSSEPEWLARTRGACFGSTPGGLPDAGGWILLIGEPAGMLGVLWVVWGRSLRADLLRARAYRRWRITGAGLAVLALVGVAALGIRVARAEALGRAPIASPSGTPMRLDMLPPAIALTDQHGRRAALRDRREHAALLTFAFGHCTTVCPTVVHDVQRARRAANRSDVRIVVITLDPWRDTPERLSSIAKQWELAPDDLVLSGTIDDVEHALDALGIGRRRNEVSGDIEHAGTAMLLNKRGRIAWRIDGGMGPVAGLLARAGGGGRSE